MASEDNKILYEVKEKIDALFRAKIPEKMGVERYSDEIEKQLAETTNQLIDFVLEISEFIIPLSHGQLNTKIPRTKNFSPNSSFVISHGCLTSTGLGGTKLFSDISLLLIAT